MRKSSTRCVWCVSYLTECSAHARSISTCTTGVGQKTDFEKSITTRTRRSSVFAASLERFVLVRRSEPWYPCRRRCHGAVLTRPAEACDSRVRGRHDGGGGGGAI